MTTTENAPGSDTPETTTTLADSVTPAEQQPEEAVAKESEAPKEVEPTDADKAASEAARMLAERKKAKAEESRNRWNAMQKERFEALARAEKAEKELSELKGKLKEPTPEAYDDNAKYTADVVQHTIDRNEANRRESEIRQQRENAENIRKEHIRERILSAIEDDPSFRSKVVDAPIPMTDTMMDAMVDSPHFAEIGFALAENVAEARKIAAMPPYQQMLAIARLEARIGNPAPKKFTQAPEPIKAVTGRSAPNTPDPEKMSYKEYKAFREKGGTL